MRMASQCAAPSYQAKDTLLFSLGHRWAQLHLSKAVLSPRTQRFPVYKDFGLNSSSSTALIMDLQTKVIQSHVKMLAEMGIQTGF